MKVKLSDAIEALDSVMCNSTTKEILLVWGGMANGENSVYFCHIRTAFNHKG